VLHRALEALRDGVDLVVAVPPWERHLNLNNRSRRADSRNPLKLRVLDLRFRKNFRGLPGSPDLVFPQSRMAVFVHGSFWHRHEGCPLATTPRSNIAYWRAKFAANQERDRRKLSELKKLGWKVAVVWQCEIEADIGRATQRIVSRLLGNRISSRMP
jgi:DNA mismatch endonuclease (patch repair protein)